MDNSDKAKQTKTGVPPREDVERQEPIKGGIRHQSNRDYDEAETHEKGKDRKEPGKNTGPKQREEKKITETPQKEKSIRTFLTFLGFRPLKTILVLALIILLLLLLLWFFGLGGGGGKPLPGSADSPNVALEKPTEKTPPEIKEKPSVKSEFLITFVPSDDPAEKPPINDMLLAKQLTCYVSWTKSATGSRETRFVKRDPQKEKKDDFLWDLEKGIRDWLKDISSSDTQNRPIIVIHKIPYPGEGTLQGIKKIVGGINKDDKLDPSIRIEEVDGPPE